MIKRKNIELALLFGLIFSVVMSFADFDASCEGLRNNILRLHIVANSDSPDDQEVKLKVRDAILQNTSCEFEKCGDLDTAITVAQADIEKITRIANKTLKENGFEYCCSASVSKEYFDTRVYEDFTLPAGEYNSLTVRLGKAEGHNWWCVVFPGVCIPAAGEKCSLEKSVDSSDAQIAYNSEKYTVRFKTVEIYEKIRQKFKKF